MQSISAYYAYHYSAKPEQEQPPLNPKAIIQKSAADYPTSTDQQTSLTRKQIVSETTRTEGNGSPLLPATNTTADNNKCPNEMSGMVAYTVECIATRGGVTLPYLLTIGEKIVQEMKGEMESVCNPVSSTPYRNRNITSDTFVCLNRPRPSHEEQKNGAVSAYEKCWQRVQVDPEEERMIFNFLSACSTKPRMGVSDNCRYTLANKLSRGLHTTHSTFWELQNKVVVR